MPQAAEPVGGAAERPLEEHIVDLRRLVRRHLGQRGLRDYRNDDLRREQRGREGALQVAAALDALLVEEGAQRAVALGLHGVQAQRVEDLAY